MSVPPSVGRRRVVVTAILCLLVTPSAWVRAQQADATPTPALTAELKKKIADAEKATASARNAVEVAERARRSAATYATQLKMLSAFKVADDAALRDMSDITEVAAAVAESDFLLGDSTHPALKSLATAKSDLQTARDALPADEGQPEQVGNARATSTAEIERVGRQEAAVKETREQLSKAILGVSSNSLRLAGLLEKRLTPISALGTDAAAKDVRATLVKHLSTFQQIERLAREASDAWDALKSALDTIENKPAGSDPEQVTQKFKELRDAVAAQPPKLRGWLVSVKSDADSRAREVRGKLDEVRGDPVMHSAAAVGLQRDTSPFADDLRKIDADWTNLEAQLKSVTYEGYDPEATAQTAAALRNSERQLKGALADLGDALAGDFSRFEADQVSLYYFTDVPRLMQILNPDTFEVGGLKGAGEEAASERRRLTSAELELADAQGEVSKYQTRVQTLREELRQAQASADATSLISKKLGLSLTSAQRDKTRADERFTKADTEATNAPDDPGKGAAKERAAAERDRAALRVEEAERRNNEADEDRKEADTRYTALRDEQSGLPARIAEAEGKLEAAQAAVNRQRKTALLAAQAESEAFVKARDNRPFWYAPASAASTDPAKHVIMWAFNDSKTLFLRGRREDLDLVKCIIAKIDKPSPQARMTLWTLELSSDASTDGTRRFNRALEIVESQLSNARAFNAAALSLLRDIVNEQVNVAAAQQQAVHPPHDADDYRIARIAGYYPKEVLFRLGFDPTRPFDRRVNDPQLARVTVPDPAGTTTLGEALMVLSLGKKEHRVNIVNNFVQRLPGHIAGLGLRDVPEVKDDTTWFPLLRRALNLDGATRTADGGLTGAQLESLRVLGLSDSQVTDVRTTPGVNAQMTKARGYGLSPEQINAVFSGYSAGEGGLSSAQVEILHAVEKVANDRTTEYARRLYERLDSVARQLRAANNVLPRCAPPECEDLTGEPGPCADAAAGAGANVPGARPSVSSLLDTAGTDDLKGLDARLDIASLQAEYCNLNRTLRPLLTRLQRRPGFTVEQIIQEVKSRGQAEAQREAAIQGGAASDSEAVKTANKRVREVETDWNRKRLVQTCDADPLRTANAREAAADQMLKDMIIAVEDDLDRLFVQPSLSHMREQLRSRAGIGVGILQRTSVLATNRLLARVDPRASAQLPLGEQTDVLGAAQQLAQIFFAAQAAGPLGALGALQSLPRKPQAELYGLTTGNVFQVTPIFDPSGQALRFKFDHVGASQIREPDGTVNPQLPRIERHTVNTEVQISNMELREVSRFESNARLGIATRYAGGLPIFKDLPFVRRVPLIGWFVRTGGKNAVTQQSLIFGQTTMYPTIGDIMDLLTTNVSN